MVSLDRELRRVHALRLWEDQLQAIDSVFVRLVFVSVLRDASGRYSHDFLVSVFSARDCHNIVAEAHREIFREWLGMSARLKLRDFQKYRDAICQRTALTEADWSSLWRELVPSRISITELNHFCETARRLAEVVCRPALGTDERPAFRVLDDGL
jgi:hypothetical protein